jgi:hypothetical protein
MSVIWNHGADPQILGNVRETKASGDGQISRYQVDITVRMAASVILNRLMYVLWRNAEVPVDSL